MNERTTQTFYGSIVEEVSVQPDTDYNFFIGQEETVTVNRTSDETIIVEGIEDGGFLVKMQIPDGVKGVLQIETTRVKSNTFATNTPDQQGTIVFIHTD